MANSIFFISLDNGASVPYTNSQIKTPQAKSINLLSISQMATLQ